MIRGNFKVNGVDFPKWFNTVFLPTQAGKMEGSYALFPHRVVEANLTHVLSILPKLTGKSSLSLNQFVAFFLFVYNETGGQFKSMPEVGGASWYASHGYNEKTKGRGLIQLTSETNYRYVLSRLSPPQNFDALTASQLDALFEKPEVYIPATKLYLTEPALAGNYWNNVENGDFATFGSKIAGAAWYGNLFAARAKALLEALKKAKITQSISNATIGISIGAVLFVAAILYFRKEILNFYKKIFAP